MRIMYIFYQLSALFLYINLTIQKTRLQYTNIALYGKIMHEGEIGYDEEGKRN